MADSCHFDNS